MLRISLALLLLVALAPMRVMSCEPEASGFRVTQTRVVTTSYSQPRSVMYVYSAPPMYSAAARPPLLLRRAPAMGYDAATIQAIRAERRQRIGGAALKIGLTAAALAFFR